jgi:hypothetical protein
MANDHYIPRFLTAPWEVPQRQLHFYDLDAGRFDRLSSESLFALEGLHSEMTGELLNKFIETPVSRHRANILRSGGQIPPLTDQNLYRALASLIVLQVQRAMDAKEPGEMSFTMDGLAAQGDKLFDAIAGMVYERHELIQVTLDSQAAPLFFTEAVYFPIPMAAAAPIMALPLTPRHFVAIPEKGYPRDQLEERLSHPMFLSALSLGFGPWSKRIVIPPESLASRDAEPLGFQKMICEQQVRGRKIFNLVGKMNDVFGLPSFIVKEHYEEDVAEAEREAAEREAAWRAEGKRIADEWQRELDGNEPDETT